MKAAGADGARLREDYERELRYLRNAGATFAREHPEVAARLELSSEGSADPHVERLLEGFAFLAARLHRTFDESTSSLAATLLEQLFPHAARPLPSSSIVHVDPDTAKIDLGTGYDLARGGAMFVDTADGTTIRFQSRFPLTLWPLRVARSALLTERLDDLSRHPDKRSVLSLRLAFPLTFDPAAANLGRLRFHVKGSNDAAARLCDLLYAHTLEVRWRDAAGRGGVLDSLPRFVGLDAEEALLPEHDDTHPGLRLLLEYFSCPAKFQFFELDCAQLGRHAGVPPGPWSGPGASCCSCWAPGPSRRWSSSPTRSCWAARRC
ncbi:type VI secretion system baseplate subunit TssF [Massilia sp. Dwa41.01b]|uniref:type VI secretion system baseplate subunit TssF n=1 Tax=Massilia sp. Dwa41.01b TaxID=2709302 RepID=UPI0015FF48FB|nr:type VI secretion system baseplate subunit TssF [Massilia sp. Dwa41.01b]QNA89235.1 type VI secretion system baseplate subunit TssF [Massilia sp. Dwa41.01b]